MSLCAVGQINRQSDNIIEANRSEESTQTIIFNPFTFPLLP